MTGTDLAAHDALQERIWADVRMGPGTREVALAIAWVLHHSEPSEPFSWKQLRVMLGHDGRLTRDGRGWRVHDLIAGDAPRYEPPRGVYEGECEGPRLRPYKPRRPNRADQCLVSDHHPHVGNCRFTQVSYLGWDGTLYSAQPPGWPEPPERDDRICGARTTRSITERDMVTGWETHRWFCIRHKERAAEVKAMLAARGTPPEPIPNAGGCLPRYFGADWAAIYARACDKSWRRPGWKSPYHGVNADEWPVPGQTVIPKRPRLALVGGGTA